MYLVVCVYARPCAPHIQCYLCSLGAEWGCRGEIPRVRTLRIYWRYLCLFQLSCLRFLGLGTAVAVRKMDPPPSRWALAIVIYNARCVYGLVVSHISQAAYADTHTSRMYACTSCADFCGCLRCVVLGRHYSDRDRDREAVKTGIYVLDMRIYTCSCTVWSWRCHHHQHLCHRRDVLRRVRFVGQLERNSAARSPHAIVLCE